MGYQQRPWTSLYQPGKPTHIDRDHDDAVSMWRASVARGGARPFIHYFETPLSFARVDADSDALAVALAERGIGRGDRIALHLQNVPQAVVAMLATWKLGAVATSINPMLKEREMGFVLRDSGARALITLEELWHAVAARVVPGSGVEVVVTTSPLDYLDQPLPDVLAGARREPAAGTLAWDAVMGAAAGAGVPEARLSAEDMALLTYTSGTTGEPKGAISSHGNVAFNAQAYREWMTLDEHDVCLAGAPLFHITGLIAHTATCALVGMPMVLSYRFHAATMNRLVERHRCTFTVMAITAFTAMMNDPTIGTCDLSSLARTYSGGAPIAPSIVERFEAATGRYIHNIYGLTETNSPVLAVPFGRRAPVDPRSGALSVGVPIFDTVVRVLGDDGAELAPGEVGELAASGPMVTPGYWNRPDATAAGLPRGELRTGDVGFMDEDGWFYLVDRKKDMIVAAGYKVWPREVEDVLVEHPAVAEAAVVGVPDEYRGETVWAYVALRPAAAASPEELIAFCRERMAAYKYPRHVEVIAELPKSPTGKILRRELRSGTRPPERDA